MSSLLISQEKILEFLKNELSKIKAESAKQKDNKKFKPKTIEKMARKLHNEIELILKTSSLDKDIRNKIIELKQQVTDSFFKGLSWSPKHRSPPINQPTLHILYLSAYKVVFRLFCNCVTISSIFSVSFTCMNSYLLIKLICSHLTGDTLFK